MNFASFLDNIAMSKAASAPIVGIAAGVTFLGLRLPEWAAIVTIVYTLLMLYLRIRREFERWKAKREGRTPPPETGMGQP